MKHAFAHTQCFSTPLGVVTCSLSCESKIHYEPTEGHFKVDDLLVCCGSYDLPSDWLKRDHPVHGHIWRWYFKALGECTRPFKLQTRLNASIPASVDTGERFVGLHYVTSDLSIMIGTEEDENIDGLYRKSLPWWKPKSARHQYDRVDEQGMSWILPVLKAGDEVYRHIIVAHGSRADASEAVDKYRYEIDQRWNGMDPR